MIAWIALVLFLAFLAVLAFSLVRTVPPECQWCGGVIDSEDDVLCTACRLHHYLNRPDA